MNNNTLSPATLDDSEDKYMCIVPIRPSWRLPNYVINYKITGYIRFTQCIRNIAVADVVDIEEGMVPDEDKVRKEIIKRWKMLTPVERVSWCNLIQEQKTYSEKVLI